MIDKKTIIIFINKSVEVVRNNVIIIIQRQFQTEYIQCIKKHITCQSITQPKLQTITLTFFNIPLFLTIFEICFFNDFRKSCVFNDLGPKFQVIFGKKGISFSPFFQKFSKKFSENHLYSENFSKIWEKIRSKIFQILPKW